MAKGPSEPTASTLDNAVDPAAITGADTAPSDSGTSGDSGRSRGRPKGSANRAERSSTEKTAKVSLDLSGLEAILFSMHQMASVAMANPILAISSDEAASLANGVSKVARHYNVKASAQALDWSNLCMVLTMVYGTRLMLLRQQQAKPEPPAPPNPNIWAPTIVGEAV